MGATDDWERFLNEQVANVGKWAQENQVATGVIIVVLSSAVIIVASKAYDMWLKG